MVDGDFCDVVRTVLEQELPPPFLFDTLTERPEFDEPRIHEQGFNILTDEQFAWLAIDHWMIGLLLGGFAVGIRQPSGEKVERGRWYWDANSRHLDGWFARLDLDKQD